MIRNVKEINRIAVSTAILAVCSWLTVPGGVPFTMQSFAVVTVAALFGGKCGFFTVLSYILLGAMGIPVFSGMRGGIGILFGETGGYLFGFLVGAFVCGKICEKNKSITVMFGAMLLNMFLCYVFGCLWVAVLYWGGENAVGVAALTGRFVLPFVIPDLIKIIVSIVVVTAIRKRGIA